MNKVSDTFSYMAGAIIGLATIAVIFSRRANTTNVITAGGQGFVKILQAALLPLFGPFGNVGVASNMPTITPQFTTGGSGPATGTGGGTDGLWPTVAPYTAPDGSTTNIAPYAWDQWQSGAYRYTP